MDIKLASEPTKVPNPPRFTPINSDLKLSVNDDSINVVGTLLIICDKITDISISLPIKFLDINVCTTSMFPIFPTNMKNETNVNNRI